MSLDESIFVEETALSEESLDDLTYTWNEQELHALKKTLLGNDNYRRQNRRFQAGMKQVQKGRAAAAKKAAKKMTIDSHS